MSLHIWRIINMFININKCSNQNKEFAWSLKTNLLIYSFNLMYVVLLLSNWACAVIRLTIIDCKAIKSYKLDFLIYVQAPGNISIYFPVHVLGIEFKSKPLSILILLGSDRWWHCQELNYLSIYVVIHHNHLHRITIQLANSGYNFNSICLPHPSLGRVSTLSYDLRYVPIPLIQLGVLKATYNNRRPSNTP